MYFYAVYIQYESILYILRTDVTYISRVRVYRIHSFVDNLGMTYCIYINIYGCFNGCSRHEYSLRNSNISNYMHWQIKLCKSAASSRLWLFVKLKWFYEYFYLLFKFFDHEHLKYRNIRSALIGNVFRFLDYFNAFTR